MLKVDGKVVATQKQANSIAVPAGVDETFDVGVDTRTAVNDKDYQVPFAFTGTIDKLTVDLGPSQSSRRPTSRRPEKQRPRPATEASSHSRANSFVAVMRIIRQNGRFWRRMAASGAGGRRVVRTCARPWAAAASASAGGGRAGRRG